MVSSRT